MAQGIPISIFNPSKNGKPGITPKPTDFYTEMDRIKNGTHFSVVQGLRDIPKDDEVARRTYKCAKLQAFTISADMGDKRSNANTKHSGLLCIDIDPKKNEWVDNWDLLRDSIFESEDVVAAFLSASGTGVAYVVKVDPKKHKDVFYSIMDDMLEQYGIHIDAGCHDYSRIRFISHDHDAKIRYDFDAIPVKEPSEAYLQKKRDKVSKVIEYTGEVGDANCDRAWNYAVKAATASKGVFGDGNKHTFLASLAGFCNTVGMALEYCESKVAAIYGPQTDIGLDRLLQPVRNIYRTYKNKHDTYKDTVEARRLNSKVTGVLVEDYLHKGIKPTPEQLDEIAETLEANIERVEGLAERVFDEHKSEFNKDARSAEPNLKPFWYVSGEDEDILINKFMFRDFLIANGIYRFRTVNKWILIRIVNNVVEEISKADVKHITISYVERLKEHQVWELIAHRVTSIFSDDYLELLPEKQVDFFRDDKDTITTFYRNGIIVVKKDDITFMNWSDFKGNVWKTQILNRDIAILDKPVTSDFETFLRNITKKDQPRFLSICSAIGYLLHGFKSRSRYPVVILNDEVISDTPQGGTGKGLLAQAISKFKNMIVFDGKSFSFDKSFVYQRVNRDTQILFFDDVRRNFDFERLFSLITEGIDVEKKGLGAFRIPFEESPKIIISTNYAVQGDLDSHERRRFELELANHYKKGFSPNDEFGKLMFDDWDEYEFACFDNFIFRCMSLYLTDGLIEQSVGNLPLKRLYGLVTKDFCDWMDEEYPHDASQPFRFDQSTAYAKYQRLYPSKLGSKSFYSYIGEYYKYHDVPYKRHKVGDVRYFYVQNNDGMNIADR